MARLLVLESTEDRKTLAEWARCLADGGIVAFATDTVWGIGARAREDAAVERIYALKGRDDRKPMACLIRSVQEARAIASGWSERIEAVAKKHWPGALTVIVRTEGLPFRAAQCGAPTIGLRVPARPAVLSVLECLGEPIAATSANRSGQPELPDAAAVMAELGAGLDLVVDDRMPVTGTASTVLEWSGSAWTVRRQGAVLIDES